jgi:hypothetical protein
MEFKETLVEFRALGGIANNVDCRQAKNGRGLFTVNSDLPIQLHCPSNLLLEHQYIELDDQKHIQVSERANANKSLKSFYEKFHKNFGWSAGGLNQIRDFHNELVLLSKDIKEFLAILGWPETSFHELNDGELLEHYLVSHQIDINSKRMITPIIEMINHSPNGNNYIIQDGVKFNGNFKDEIFANYNCNIDMFHFYRNYQFVSPTNYLLSCDVSFDFPSIGRVFISRFDNILNKDGSLKLPQVKKTKDQLSISFVELFNKEGNTREIFYELMKAHDISSTKANEIFDGLIEHNKQVLNSFLEACNKSEGRVIKDLKTIAKTHLRILK